MSRVQKVSYLSELKSYRIDCSIQVKVLHTWKQTNAGYVETLEIVFDDKKGDKIQATCKHAYLISLGSKCVVDVIGQDLDVGELQIIQCQNGKILKKIEFTLRDMSDQRLACCLWGKFVEMLEPYSEESQMGVVVCLIMFAKIGSFREVVINPTIQEADDLKEAFKYDDSSMSMVESNQDDNQMVKAEKKINIYRWNEYEDKTIVELLKSTHIEKCKVIATIYVVDTRPWVVLFCKISATDVIANMIVDESATKILNESATKILNGSLDEIEDPELLPRSIKDVLGKTFKFGITIEKENIDYGVEYYKVFKVWSIANLITVGEMSDTTSAKETTLTIGDEGSQMIEGEESSVLNTPSSKCAQEERDEVPELTSTSKKLSLLLHQRRCVLRLSRLRSFQKRR
ncbi:hypothetical protein F2Q69_00006168 [Brassica cretica]|uniref:Replication protein A 70 kDa DNA-binding subunit B/D first OB fold domain-containing protein n=1 Tax=Brassica cretica TaxID=69181 RepID=A0A8S9PAC2_BRACR|nr:hypothetical protein F2Q69_00006168 [Brassica cretica]